MDLLQQLALLVLGSMVVYLAMVNLFGKDPAIKSPGQIDLGPMGKLQTETSAATSQAHPVMNHPHNQDTHISIGHDIDSAHQKADEQELITNRLPLGQNSSMINGSAAPLGNSMGLEHGFNTGRDPIKPVLTTSSVFNEHATGVLPQNHDLFDKPADFGSDVTNINQFYRNNPELFHQGNQNGGASKGAAYVPNVSDWEAQGHAMQQQMANQPQEEVNAYNFDTVHSPHMS